MMKRKSIVIILGIFINMYLPVQAMKTWDDSDYAREMITGLYEDTDNEVEDSDSDDFIVDVTA